jgi:hypothetical protein
MTYNHMTVRRHWVTMTCQLTTALLLAAGARDAAAQTERRQQQLGIVAFVDATGENSATAGAALGRVLHAELTAASALEPIALNESRSTGAEADHTHAIALGKQREVDFVFIGTVLEAKTEESSKGGWLPRIKGQQLHVQLRSIKAKAIVQGEIYAVATGERVASMRVTGEHGDRQYGGRVWSSWGSWDVGDHSAFLASPLGKAFHKAVREIVQKVNAQLTAGAK